MAKSAIFTIGYEGRALDELLAMLAAEKIERVIDIRDLPLSRRHGFSKTPLGEALRGVGIDYMHMESAGNPYRKQRIRFRAASSSEVQKAHREGRRCRRRGRRSGARQAGRVALLRSGAR